MASKFKKFKDKKSSEAYSVSGGLMQYTAYKKSVWPKKKKHGKHK